MTYKGSPGFSASSWAALCTLASRSSRTICTLMCPAHGERKVGQTMRYSRSRKFPTRTCSGRLQRAMERRMDDLRPLFRRTHLVSALKGEAYLERSKQHASLGIFSRKSNKLLLLNISLLERESTSYGYFSIFCGKKY